MLVATQFFRFCIPLQRLVNQKIVLLYKYNPYIMENLEKKNLLLSLLSINVIVKPKTSTTTSTGSTKSPTPRTIAPVVVAKAVVVATVRFSYH